MSYNLHNGGTGGRPGSTHTEEHKEWLRERFSGEGNPMYGKPVPDEVRKKLSEALKGREFSEETIKKMKEARKGEKHPYYGKTFPDEWKANLSKALSGKNNPNYGVKMSDEQKKKLSIANSGENHPMYGKEITDEHRANLSKAMMGKNNPMYGKKHSNEHREKIGKANLEVKQKITECPHCGKSGGYRLLTRFHFDNCKFKSRIKIEVEDGKEFFTVQELVKLFSTSRNSIFRLIDNGMIEAIKVPPYQAFHIPVDKFIKKFGLK